MSDTSAIDTTGTPASLLQQIQKLQPPKAPTLAPVPAAPVAQITNPLKAMSPGLMLLATLGGALTRAPITTALNNATGFINGVKAGNQYVTKTRLDNFNAAIKQATAANATATDQYKLAMSQYGNDATKLQQDLLGIASEHGDDPVKALLESGDIKDAVNLIESREKSADALREHQDMLNLRVDAAWKPVMMRLSDGQLTTGQRNTLTGAYRDDAGNEIKPQTVASVFPQTALTSLGQPQMVETKDGKQVLAQQDKVGAITGHPGEWVTADQKHTPISDVVGAVSATTAGLPGANESMAHMIATYQIPPLTGYALRSASGQQIMADVMKENPQYNANRYEQARKVMDAFATGPERTRLTAINVAIQHLGVLQQLADALKSGDTRAVNAADQAIKKQFGSNAPTNFDAVVKIVGQEVVKAIVNAGGGERERDAAAQAFSRIGAPSQVSGAIMSVKRLMAGQVMGLRNQYDSSLEGIPGVVPFDKFLLPETAKELNNINVSSSSVPSNVIRYDANGNRIP